MFKSNCLKSSLAFFVVVILEIAGAATNSNLAYGNMPGPTAITVPTGSNGSTGSTGSRDVSGQTGYYNCREKAVEHRKYHLLVTGCPHSGTGYISKVLTESGIQIGHELFCEDGLSSWGFAPREIRSDFDFLHVFHQVRHPLKNITSLYREPTTSFNEIIAWIRRWIPEIQDTDTKIVKCTKFWYYWNLLLNEDAEFCYRVEDIENSWSELEDRIGKKLDISVLRKIPKNVNTRIPKNGKTGVNSERRTLTWAELKVCIPEDLYQNVRALSKHYGYEQ